MRTQTNDAAPLGRPGKDVAGRSPERRWPPLTRTHKILFGAVIVLYAVVVVGVLTNSWMVALDWDTMLIRPYKRWPQLLPYLNVWIIAGQRGPSAIAACIWLVWRSHRARSMRPLLVMGTALLLLNMTVGGVKIVTGRLGPHYAHYMGSPELFAGGQIFPSGHTANSVVTWGVLAYLAVRHRRAGALVAGITAASIGLTTVYLGTHWISDVLAGWTAGVLVLLVLPLFEPVITSVDDRIQQLWRGRRGASQPSPAPATAQGWSGWDQAVRDELAGVGGFSDDQTDRPTGRPTGRRGIPG
ncbi:phosphatase PAP2 family protein [Peterkaempfera sp. SMS 1(5)a]|uniref:phosphatase PAP2 family protein n=1 Tax=Peterkaempfera podocarpi TaxID=3232308 RepID=UPI00366A6C1C